MPWPTAWSEWIRSVQPNVVVLLAGRWEVDDRSYLGHRTNILHAAYAAYTKQQLEKAVRIGTSTGARMVLMTAPCYSEGEQLNGDPWPQDDIRRVEKYNSLVRAVGAEFPSQVTVQDLYAMTCPGGKFVATLDGKPLRDGDGVHFSPAPGGGALLAPQILPLWETLGHEQEAAGGTVQTGRAPQYTQLPRASGTAPACREMRQGRRGDGGRPLGRDRTGTAGRVGADQARFGLLHAGVGVHSGRRPVSARRRVVGPGPGFDPAPGRFRARGAVCST